jgi:hypothetical protein
LLARHFAAGQKAHDTRKGDSMLDWQPLKTADLIIAFAALMGPILAVQAQKWIENWRAAKERRVRIFRTLMATRATRLAPQHVEALNSIPLDFSKDRAVMDRWEEYFAHLMMDDTSLEVWGATAQNLFVALVIQIAKSIGYQFNGADMQRIYFPKGHKQIQDDQFVIQRGLALLLSGQLPLRMAVTELPGPDEASEKQQEELRKAVLKWLSGDKAAPIDMRETRQRKAS